MGANYRREATFPEDAKTFTPVAAGEGAKFGGMLANCVWVGVSGNVEIVKDNDDKVVMPALIAGTWHPMAPFKRINSTLTTATGIVVGITFRV